MHCWNDGVDVEIVFVSGDQSDSEFASYYAEMPWLAFPLGDPRCHVLSQKYGVSGVPTLVWITGDGTLISKEGRSMVSGDPSGASVVSAADAAESKS